MKSSLFEINLLPKKKNKVADKLLYFVLYYFRYIIVLTQIVVIGVFFYRFRVDQQVIDQKESFKQKQQILAVTIPIVEEAKIIEAKTNNVKEIIDGQKLLLAKQSTVLNNIPEDVSLYSLDITQDSITITGNSGNVFSIRALHARLVKFEGFESAVINSIERTGDGSFDFNISIEEANA